jgi:cytoskeleton protein RodZ
MADAAAPTSLGDYLRALRSAKQGSLEDIARATRVSASQLQALEAERFSELPAPVFVKGFIRGYCEFLGEPPDEALRRYRELIGERPAPPRGRLAPRPADAWSGNPLVLSLALLGLFGFGLLAVNLVFKGGAKPVATAPAPTERMDPAERAAPATPGRSAAPAVSAPSSPRAAKSGPAPQRLVVKAIEPAWIRIQADEGRAVEELLAPGDTRQWTAEKRFVLTIGNAGGIELELNGRAIPPLGARGAVIRQLELPLAASAGS